MKLCKLPTKKRNQYMKFEAKNDAFLKKIIGGDNTGNKDQEKVQI